MRLGDNANAFLGGFRLWSEVALAKGIQYPPGKCVTFARHQALHA